MKKKIYNDNNDENNVQNKDKKIYILKKRKKND